MKALTTMQQKAMDAAKSHGALAQRSLSASAATVEMYPGADGSKGSESFPFSTVASLVKRGALKWASKRASAYSRWVAVPVES